MKTPDEFAREFKLHACIGNKKFAAQIRAIQADALQNPPNKTKEHDYHVTITRDKPALRRQERY